MTQESRITSFEKALKDEGIAGTNLEPVARSIFQQESSSGANVKTSNAGARGPMQVLPATFKAYNPQGNIDDPYDNSVGGLRYIKDLFSKTNDPGLTAIGYYGGPKAIEKARQGIAVSDPRNPNAPNTLQYMEQVMGRTKGSQAQPTPRGNKPPVNPLIKQKITDLGPSYQAALALMAKADDLSEAREKIAEEEELASAGADFSQAKQMLAQIKPTSPFPAQEPRRMAGGGEAKIEEGLDPSLRFQSIEKPKDFNLEPGVYQQGPQGMVGRAGFEYRGEGSSYRGGASAVAIKLPDGSIKIIPAAYDVGYSTKIGPGELELSANRAMKAAPGRNPEWGARVNYRIPIGKAEGGLLSATIAPRPVLSSKDKAKQAEYEKKVKEYEAQRTTYNTALDKYNAEIYNPYKAKVDEYNKAVEAYEKVPVQQWGGNYAQGSGYSAGRYYDRNYYNRGGGMYVPRAPVAGDYLGAVDQYNIFSINPGYYFENGFIKGKPGFNQVAPTAPNPFDMTAPVASVTQEELDAFAKQAAEKAQQNATLRGRAMQAVQDPSRFNFGSVGLGDISGFAGTSTRLFAEGGEVEKKPEPSMGEKVKGTAKEILRSTQYTPYDLLGAPVDIINLGLKGVDYVTGSKLATEKPVGGSDYLIQKSRELGIADKPTGSTTETLTRLGTGILSPTAGPRAVVAAGQAVKGTAKAALEDLAMASTGQGGSNLAQKIMAPGTAFAVRPKGGVYLGAKSVDEPALVRSDIELQNVLGDVDASTEQGAAIKQFFDKKARSFIQNQYGTADDPVFKKVLEGQIPANQFFISPEKIQRYRDSGSKETLKAVRDAYDAETGVTALINKAVAKAKGEGYSSTHLYKVQQDIKDLIAKQSPDNPTTLMTSIRPLEQQTIREYPSLYDFPGMKQLVEEGDKKGIASLLSRSDLPPHIRQAITQGDPVFTNILSMNALKLGELKDYLSTRSANEIKNMGFADALAKSSQWHEMLANAKSNPEKFSRKELFAGTEPIAKAKDDYSWVDVKTKEALTIEGCIMGHCVGNRPSYLEGVVNGTKKIYSLRDKKGVPHVTIELNKTNQVPMYNWDGSVRQEVDPSKKDAFNQVAQIKGTANTPAENYFPQINEFLTDYSNKIGDDLTFTELPRYLPENWRNK